MPTAKSVFLLENAYSFVLDGETDLMGTVPFPHFRCMAGRTSSAPCFA